MVHKPVPIDKQPTDSIDGAFNLEKIDIRFRRIFELAIPFLNTRHNLIHTFIVYQYALRLMEKEPGSPEVILPSCILHDVGWSSIPEEKQLLAFGPVIKDESLRRKHEVEGVKIANRILGDLGYEALFMDKITRIIDGHDTTTEARSSEDAIVKDSDKLFRFSSSGFRIDAERFQIDFPSRVKFLSGIIDEWFLTRTGKTLAENEIYRRANESSISLKLRMFPPDSGGHSPPYESCVHRNSPLWSEENE